MCDNFHNNNCFEYYWITDGDLNTDKTDQLCGHVWLFPAAAAVEGHAAARLLTEDSGKWTYSSRSFFIFYCLLIKGWTVWLADTFASHYVISGRLTNHSSSQHQGYNTSASYNMCINPVSWHILLLLRRFHALHTYLNMINVFGLKKKKFLSVWSKHLYCTFFFKIPSVIIW